VVVAGFVGLLFGIMIGSSGHSTTTSGTTTSAAAATKTATPAIAAPAPAPVAAAMSFGPGTYEVGTGDGEIPPGKYKSTGPDGSNPAGCYYGRLRNNDGSVTDILSNDVSQGPTLFTAKPTDGYINIVGCTFAKA